LAVARYFVVEGIVEDFALLTELVTTRCIVISTCLLPIIVIFSYIYILQGSVATQLRCGGVFSIPFIANCPLSVPVREFWKSFNIRRRYWQRQSGKIYTVSQKKRHHFYFCDIFVRFHPILL